jgi:hypothetical protein
VEGHGNSKYGDISERSGREEFSSFLEHFVKAAPAGHHPAVNKGHLLPAICFDVNYRCILYIDILLAAGVLSIKSPPYIYLLLRRFVSSVEHLADLP